MPETSYEKLIKFAEQHGLADDTLVHFVAGYGDIIESWLQTPGQLDTLPMSFDEFLESLNRSLTTTPEGVDRDCRTE